MSLGILYGVSIGPGDPELITVKGLKILQSAEIVAFPAGVKNRTGVAEQIISSWLKPDQRTLSLHFPYTQDESILQASWQEAARQVGQYLNQGLNIAFACLGDVNLYSTFNYLAQAVHQNYPEITVQTIPGVSSPMAIASALGIPLTIQKQNLAILPTLYSLQDLERVLTWAEVVILLKFSSVYQEVWQLLQHKNLLAESYIVEKISCPEEKIYRDLSKYPELKLSYFSVMLIQTKSIPVMT